MSRSMKLSMICGVLSVLASCGPSPETTKPPVSSLEMKEALYHRGHQLLLEQQFDSAQVVLKRALAMDASYIAPLTDLGQLHYDLGMREAGEKNPRRLEQLRKSRDYFAKVDALGSKESDLYERLCEISHALDDDRSFLKYAKKNAEAYPYDRQYFNLGSAYFLTGDFQRVIKSQKEAIEKFKSSQYIGSFYRQLGRAYMKVDRDQTAERTFDAGLKAVEVRIADHKKTGSDYKGTDEYRRLMDDRIGMLVSLKGLHQTYRAKEKLERVEKQLQEAGYTK